MKLKAKSKEIENIMIKMYDDSPKWLWGITCTLVFGVLFFMYQTVEFYSDDLMYMMCWDESRGPISTIGDIIEFQYNHYMKWGGRAVAHTWLQILFLMGRPWSAIVNALGYMALAYMIMECSLIKKNVFVYAEIVSVLYFLNPKFQETMLWYTGNANYMWTTLLILLAMYPFIRLFELKKFNSKWFWICPIYFLAGWTNENMAPSMLLFMLCSMVYIYWMEKKIILNAIVATLLGIAGCACLFFAPGNFVRADSLPSGLLSIAYRGHGQVNSWCNWLFITWIILLVMLMILKNRGYVMPIRIKAIVGMAVVSVLVMIASPSYPQRASFGSFVIILIAIYSLSEELFTKNIVGKRIIIDVMMILAWAGTLLAIAILALVRSNGVYIPG